jgi:hypothetical protein
MVGMPRASAWMAVIAACLASGCSLAGAREEEFVRANVATISGVKSVEASCGSGWLRAKSDVCVTVGMATGKELRFIGVGYQSFDSAPSRVRVTAAGGRSPLVVSCQSQLDFADLDRSGLFGHHFSPALEAVPEAVLRSEDVVEEFEFWPQCPQFWELASEQGTIYRYCAHPSGKPAEWPPRPCS